MNVALKISLIILAIIAAVMVQGLLYGIMARMFLTVIGWHG